MPRCASQVLDRGAQADARDAVQVLDNGAQAGACGAARNASQILARGAQAVASLCVTGTWSLYTGRSRGAAQVLDRAV
jgi:hypothetical protein